MSLQIRRLDSNATRNAGKTIIASVPTKDTMNGHSVNIVVAQDDWREEYVTWEQGWISDTTEKEGKSVITWSMVFSNGHYFRIDLTRPNAREDAITDMM